MTYGGGYGGPGGDPFGSDPFGSDPFGAPAGNPAGPPTTYSSHPPGGHLPAPQPPQGEVNSLATLSVVFAFVFAPAGAVLGHMAMSQIRRLGQRGRERALIGLTLSYVIIVLAVIALAVWLSLGSGSDSAPTTPATTTTAATTTPRAAPPPPPRTTVVTPTPTQRPTVRIEDLRVGDCVEVQQNQPIPGKPNTDEIYTYRVPCQVRPGVLRVDQLTGDRSACPNYSLFNLEETLFACVSDFRG